MSAKLAFDAATDLALNLNGWGPAIDTKNAAHLIPFQSFNKSDRLGMVADWTGDTYSDKRALLKYQVQFSRQEYNAEDDEAFQLVDQAKSQRPGQRRNMGNRMGNKNFRNQRGQRTGPGGNFQTLRKNQQQNPRNQNQRNQKFGGRPGQRRYDNKQNAKKRDASVNIRPEWKILEELDFPRLGKLSLPNVGDGEDVYTCGSLEYYDKSYDRVNCKTEKRLQRINRLTHNVTTTDDPIIRTMAKNPDFNVFATDSVISTLMCATRSVTSWDIIVQRIGDKLFFDKREESDFDLVTVNETAAEPPFNDDSNSLNNPRSLAMEATFINHNFSQQVLKKSEDRYSFKNPNPFIGDEDSGEVSSIAYRYRKFDLENDVKLLVRCQHDAATVGGNGETQFMSIHALNEYDSRIAGAIDWRQKLDIQRGAVLANELKNNSCKLAKWTTEAHLAGSDHLKFGYVSRIHFRDSVKHAILGTQQFKPREFAEQIALKFDNAWGILRCLIDMCMKLSAGKYLILKDPNKPTIIIYDIPNDSFDGSGSEDEDDDDIPEEAEEAEDKN